ncbi:MAG: hypothetical protein R6U13_12785 [Desulfatiglandaceae bacterium]
MVFLPEMFGKGVLEGIAATEAGNNAANVFDVFVMVGFGLLGYVLTKCRINLPTVIVDYFLGPLLETNLRHALSISGGDWSVFVTRPISVGFLIFTVFAVWFLLRRRKPLA